MVIGYKYRIFYYKNNPNNKIIHIRQIVDDNQVVYMWWSKTKRRWIYEIDTKYFFEIGNEHIKKLGKSKI